MTVQLSARLSRDLPVSLYRCTQTKAIDQAAIQEGGIPGLVLMKRAARAAFDFLLELWPQHQILVLAGSGNNGGDGYVLAGIAASRGLSVRVMFVEDPARLSGDASAAHAFAVQEKVVIQAFDPLIPPILPANTVLVDALLGIGMTGDVRPAFAHAITWMNQSGLPVLSLDLPSGLCGDTGAELGMAVRAAATICFVALKQGLVTGRGPGLCGQLRFDNLQIPESFYPPADVSRIDWGSQQPLLPLRQADAHKGHFGQALIIGGDSGFGGAALMASEAALTVGAGLVSLATREAHVTASLVRQPEVMAIGVRGGQDLTPLLNRATALVIGPGLGRSAWSEQLLQQALAAKLPTVLDADGLNLLASSRSQADLPQDHWVLTPHPTEAARLLNITTADVLADRFAAATRLQAKFGGVIVLKGAGTLIADGQTVQVASVGNAGLATGGTGDVLSGIIGGLLAQGLSLGDAARLGVCLHGAAAEWIKAERGIRGMVATDLLPAIKVLLND